MAKTSYVFPAGPRIPFHTVVAGESRLAASLSKNCDGILGKGKLAYLGVKEGLSKQDRKAEENMPRSLRELYTDSLRKARTELLLNADPEKLFNEALSGFDNHLKKEERAVFGCDHTSPGFRAKLKKHAAYVKKMRAIKDKAEQRVFILEHSKDAFGISIPTLFFDKHRDLQAGVAKSAEFYGRLFGGMNGATDEQVRAMLVEIADQNSAKVDLYLDFQPKEDSPTLPKVSLIFANSSKSQLKLDLYDDRMHVAADRARCMLELREPIQVDSLPLLPKKVDSILAVAPLRAFDLVAHLFDGILAGLFNRPGVPKEGLYASLRETS